MVPRGSALLRCTPQCIIQVEYLNWVEVCTLFYRVFPLTFNQRTKNMRKSLLEKYKRRLDQEQEDLRALMSRRGQDIRANDGEVPEDSAEQAANAYSKEFVFHQTGSERARLSLVNRALTRIESPEFGSCESCEKTIERKRLDAVPWARYCRVCQELEEELNSSSESSNFINEMK